MYDKLLLSLGYTDITKVRDNNRCWIAKANCPDGPKFLKVVRGEDEFDSLRHEVAFNECMRLQSHAPTPFVVPRSRYFEKGIYQIAEFERIDAAWLHESKLPDYAHPFSDQDLEQIYLAIRHLRSLPRRILPPLLASETSPSVTTSRRKLNHLYSVMDTVISRDLDPNVWEQTRDMITGVKDAPVHYCLTHQDLAPKNIGRLPGGRIAIVDAEFAQWNFSWMDAVKMLMELWTREERPEVARQFFRHILARHRSERQVDDDAEILFTFQHYVVEYLEKATRKDAHQTDLGRVIEVLERTRTGNLDAIIAP